MAYERDSDRDTRGVGAIAALDRRGGARYRRRVQSGVATRQRDRAMVAVERGALGGIDLPVRGSRTRPGGSGPTTPNPKLFSPVLKKAASVIIKAPVVAPTSVDLFSPVLKKAASVIIKAMPPVVPDAVAPIDPIDIPAAKPPVLEPGESPPIWTGASGSGIAPTGGPGIVTTIAPITPLPDTPIPSAPDNKMRNVLLLGAAAGAAISLRSTTAAAAAGL